MEHHRSTDPAKAWQEGWGYFLRLRSLLTVGSLKAMLAVISFVKLELPVAVALSIVLSVLYAILWGVRYHRIQLAKIAEKTHELVHWLRENTAGLVQHAIGMSKKSQYDLVYKNFNDGIAEKIALLLRTIINNNDIYCCIRLATMIDGKECYVTVGRSSGMDPSRPENSEPIPSTEGVARYLRQKNRLGVIIIKDLQKAAKSAGWFETKNDSLPDINSLMVAPINGFVAGNKCMIGILYICSKHDMFNQFHVDIVRSCSDMLGNTYPMLPSGSTV